MPFANEMVSQENIDKYGLRELNRKFMIADFGYQWTVDHSKEIYLRRMRNSRDNPSEEDFTFYWGGDLVQICLERNGGGIPGGKGQTTWTLIPSGRLNPPLFKGVETLPTEALIDLKEALVAYKDFGVYSTISDHTALFEF